MARDFLSNSSLAGYVYFGNSTCKVNKNKHSLHVWAWFSTTGGIGSICRVDSFPSKIIEVFNDEFSPEQLTDFKINSVTFMDEKASHITDAMQEWISGKDKIAADPWPENFKESWPFRKVWLDLEQSIGLHLKQPGNKKDLWVLIERF
ncbi:Uncharacterized protein APZ42_025342 [Daphnia magna]|uniref:Uncharacterized protein n=1 Tax=Daphnia magna TaxID=35525 RepID=A0A164T699_9CRUS|nr:Uncharacterized protein APZ42_025342 [Daphnia magna]